MKTDTLYALSVQSPKGASISMDKFKGKTLLIVNTATRCGFAPQFKALETLHQKYRDMGLVVIGFPCNQFGNQEPETNDSIEEACEINFGVTFQLTEKVNVNGPESHPVFFHLKKSVPSLWGKRIKWNFTKFLIGPDGKTFKRYAPTVKPEKMEKDIQSLLQIQK